MGNAGERRGAGGFRRLPERGSFGELRGMALFGSIATVRAQLPQAEKFAAAFAYLDKLFHEGSPESKRLRAMHVGESHRAELADGLFALEQVYLSKVRADGFFESHRKFVDVQVVVEGEEGMETADIARATVRRPYNAERDFIVYENTATASLLHVSAGQAALFFPPDVHMPGLCGDAGPTLVRKTVIKVPV